MIQHNQHLSMISEHCTLLTCSNLRITAKHKIGNQTTFSKIAHNDIWLPPPTMFNTTS